MAAENESKPFIINSLHAAPRGLIRETLHSYCGKIEIQILRGVPMVGIPKNLPKSFVGNFLQIVLSFLRTETRLSGIPWSSHYRLLLDEVNKCRRKTHHHSHPC
jgi:hypothetical protein